MRCCEGDVERALQVVELEDHDEASTGGSVSLPFISSGGCDIPRGIPQEGKNGRDQAFALDHGVPDRIQFVVAHCARSAPQRYARERDVLCFKANRLFPFLPGES